MTVTVNLSEPRSLPVLLLLEAYHKVVELERSLLVEHVHKADQQVTGLTFRSSYENCDEL